MVTVIGEPDSNRKAMQMILEKILEDPQSGSCLNISYSDVHGLVANFNPTGSPFAQAILIWQFWLTIVPLWTTEVFQSSKICPPNSIVDF